MEKLRRTATHERLTEQQRKIVASIGPVESHGLDAWTALKAEAVDIASGKDTDHGAWAVFSEVDSTTKESEGYIYCTGVAVVGTRKGMPDNISFLTHQFTDGAIEDEKTRSMFEKKLVSHLRELKEKSQPGSIDAVVFGGMKSTHYQDYTKYYNQLLKFLEKCIQKELGFTPQVVLEPGGRASNDVILDTQNRRLFIARTDETPNPWFDSETDEN